MWMAFFRGTPVWGQGTDTSMSRATCELATVFVSRTSKVYLQDLDAF